MVTRSSGIQKIFYAVLATLVLFIAGTIVVRGQNNQGNGLALSTLVEEVEADPGQRITLEEPIVVKNVTSAVVQVQVSFNDFLPAEDESGTPQIVVTEAEEPNEFGLRTYFQPIDDFSLDPGEDASIPVTLDVPTNATPGGHYGVVRFTAQNPIDPEQDVTLSASVGTLVFLNVSGEEVEELSVVEFSAAKNGDTGMFFTGGPLSIVTRMQNTGNTHVAPFGKIEVRNMLGTVVQTIELNSQDTRRGFVLPDSIRRFENELEDKFYLGRYSVSGNLSYGDGGGSIINVSTSFWVLPWRIILGALAGLVIIIGGGRYFLKSYTKKIQKKSRRF